MQHQQGLLISRLDRHEPHRWPCHGLADGGRVGSIVFRPFDITLHVARRHQTDVVTELGDFASPMMSGSAGFHTDQAALRVHEVSPRSSVFAAAVMTALIKRTTGLDCGSKNTFASLK